MKIWHLAIWVGLGVVEAFGVDCIGLLGKSPWKNELYRYETIRKHHLRPQADLKDFRPVHNVTVTERNAQGQATRGSITVLVDNPGQSIAVISEANQWGLALTPEDYLKPVANSPYYRGTFRGLRHGLEYRLLVNGKQVIDPASDTYTSGPYLNSVFWDWDRPNAYHQKHPGVDLRGKYPVIAEFVLAEIVKQWGGGPPNRESTYRYVADSGVIQKLKEMGYNAVELLPFNSSIDGDRWDFRYQVFGQYGPDSRHGTPDDFAYLIDKFHEAGMAVIMDAVIGHYPHRGNTGPRSLEAVGPYNWKKADGRALYGEADSPWSTKRYDFANPYVRRFLTEGGINHFKRYRLDGVRVDNLDGVRMYHEGGGEAMLQEFAGTVRYYRPDAHLIGEMFFGENRVLQRLDWFGGLGFDQRTHSDLFDFFKDNWLKYTENINMAQVRNAIRDPWNWGELMRVQYPTNHDEAANRRDGATGSYPATLLNGGGWDYVVKKTKAWGALAMLSGSSYLDLPQMRILQEGDYWRNPHMEWWLLQYEAQRNTMEFFASMSRLVQEKPHFLAENLHPNVENHTDYDNKVISLERINHETGKKIYVVINLGHGGHYNYRVGVDAATHGFRTLLSTEYPFNAQWFDKHHVGSNGKQSSIVIPHLRPYEVLVIEQP